MLPLAVNSVTSQSMRPKYALAVGALPNALMFASLVPLARFATWLEGALSIPHNAPIRDQPNGTLWLVVFLVVMVLGMIAGYALGWILNACIARYMFLWPA